MTSPVPAPPACGPAAVAAVPAKIVTAPTGEQRRARPAPRAGRPRARALARLAVRAPVQRDGRDEDQHRQHVVAHDEAGREVVDDRQAAEHRLRDDAERQQQRRARRGRGGTAGGKNASSARGDAAKPTKPDQHAVAELDDAVRVELGASDVVGALRPLGQPRPEPVTRTAAPVNTISVSMHERDAGDLRVALGGDLR